MKIVPATREHIDKLVGEPPKHSFRGFSVVKDDGTVIGCAGGYHVGREAHVAFMHITDELRAKPKMLVKLALSLRNLPHDIVYAYCDENIEAARRFLERYGFTDRGDGVFIYRRT